jgi:hypothetical protein
MAKKAQAEFIVIAGIVILALVVVYYAFSGEFQPSNVPQGVFERQKAVQESFLSMARKGADNTLNVMETHGGYPTQELLGEGNYETPSFAVFMEEGVPYWARCQNNLTPSRDDMTRWFRLSMEHYIQTHMNEITGTYKNASFDLSKLSVSVNILSSPNKIEITVNLPTKVDGYAVQNPLYPYKISLDSKLGEIYDFAGDFSKAQSSKRFLEVYTTASIYMSKYAADGHAKLPTGGFLLDCGETVYRTPDQISSYLKEIAEYVVTQMLWWQNMTTDKSKPKLYAVNKEIMDREYRDLEINMYLPDDFSFNTQGTIVAKNNKRAFTSPMWTASDCFGVYSMGYAVSYPVIVRVKDPLSGYYFNFAVLVFVDKSGSRMIPGKCEDIHTIEDACKDVACSARIKVTDEAGRPIQGAVATFGECGIGYSDSSGVIQGNIKCGTDELNIYRNSSYDYYNQNVSSSSINGTYILSSIANITANFKRVTISEQGIGQNLIKKCVMGKVTDYAFVDFVSGDKPYMITNIDSESVPENCVDEDCLDQCQASMDIAQCSQCASNCMGNVLDSVINDFIPAGIYDTNATMMGMSIMKETGGFITPYALKTSVKTIYINIPESSPVYQISVASKLLLAQSLRECQIEPISESAYPKTTIVISCTCENLKAVWEDVKTGCTPDIGNLFCTCPSGTAFSAGCGKPCGGQYLPDCITCCNLEQIKQQVQGWISSCDTRVICK